MFGSKHKREGERNSRSKGMRDNREVTERGGGGGRGEGWREEHRLRGNHEMNEKTGQSTYIPRRKKGLTLQRQYD